MSTPIKITTAPADAVETWQMHGLTYFRDSAGAVFFMEPVAVVAAVPNEPAMPVVELDLPVDEAAAPCADTPTPAITVEAEPSAARPKSRRRRQPADAPKVGRTPARGTRATL